MESIDDDMFGVTTFYLNHLLLPGDPGVPGSSEVCYHTVFVFLTNPSFPIITKTKLPPGNHPYQENNIYLFVFINYPHSKALPHLLVSSIC